MCEIGASTSIVTCGQVRPPSYYNPLAVQQDQIPNNHIGMNKGH
jgi:hypothetical protein